MLKSGYWKAWLAVIGAAVYALYAGLAAGSPGGAGFTAAETIGVAAAFGGAFLVYVSPNLAGGVGEFTKVLVEGILAVLAVLAGLMEGGLTAQEWVGILILFATTVGVFGAPAPKHPV